MTSQKELNKLVESLLKKNPHIKEAMRVFDMSFKEYRKAIKALSKKSVVINSKTTSSYGDMAGNK